LNPHPEQRYASRHPEASEVVKLLAYQLWLARRESNIAGDANCDYYQAEQILQSRRNLKRLLGSFGFSAVAFVLGHSQEEHYTNATNALIGLHELGSASASVSEDGSDGAA
jgi:hypothetical protein